MESTSLAAPLLSEAQTDSEPVNKYALLNRLLEGEVISDDEFKAASEQAVVIPDEHLGDALRVSMLAIHKELAMTLDTFRAVAARAKLNADADKEQKVMRPLGGLAILLYGKLDGYCLAVERADEKRLLHSRNRMRKFAALYEGLLPGLLDLWNAREADPDSDEAVEALQIVGQMAKVAIESEKYVHHEAKTEYEKLSRREKAYVDAYSVGLHERRARLKRDLLVQAMGGASQEDEQEPN